jgi:hypothetical protein
MKRASSAQNGSPCLRDDLAGPLDAGTSRGQHPHGPLDFTDSTGLSGLVSALKRFRANDLDCEGDAEGDKDPIGG